METQIFWYQTLNVFPIFLGVIVFFLVILANFKNKHGAPLEKVLIPAGAVLALVVAGMCSRAEISAEKGTQFSKDLLRWQEEAASIPDLELRPEMLEMIAYLEKHNNGDIGELRKIRDHLSYDMLNESYLSYLDYQKFDSFVAACDKRAGAIHSYEGQLLGYPIAVSKVRAYIKTLSNQGALLKECEMAVPLITLK